MATMPMPNTPLTDIEREALHWVADGLTNAEIATKMVRSPATIKGYLISIQIRINARNRTHAVKRGYELGYLVIGVDQ